MVDYGNHEWFSLRCLSAGLSPVSIRLKDTVRTSRRYEVIRRAEKQLLNERIRGINNAMKISSLEIDTCVYQLASVLDQDTFKD